MKSLLKIASLAKYANYKAALANLRSVNPAMILTLVEARALRPFVEVSMVLTKVLLVTAKQFSMAACSNQR